jgi:hypothetical protein
VKVLLPRNCLQFSTEKDASFVEGYPLHLESPEEYPLVHPVFSRAVQTKTNINIAMCIEN